MTGTTGTAAELDPAPESAPRFTAVTVAALRGAGRQVEIDWEQETFEVQPPGAGGVHISGVMLPSEHAVAFYAVWTDLVPSDARDAIALWSVRANTDLATATVEFSMDSGILATRTVVRLGALTVGTPGDDIPEESLAISQAGYAALLTAAIDAAASAFAKLQKPVAEAITGQ